MAFRTNPIDSRNVSREIDRLDLLCPEIDLRRYLVLLPIPDIQYGDITHLHPVNVQIYILRRGVRLAATDTGRDKIASEPVDHCFQPDF